MPILPLKQAVIAAVLAVPLVAAAPAAFATDKPADFVQKASEAGMFEVKSSQLALKLSKNPEVRAFAQAMIRDHEKADAALAATAKASAFEPAIALDQNYQGKLDQLRA